MRINTNVNSMRTQEYMRQNQAKMDTAMNRLSSGKRINSAADDAAGLAIATRMRTRESGLSKASENTQAGMNLIRTAESAMGSISNILTRMRDLAVQSSTGTNSPENRAALDKEFTALKEQIDYISDNTDFNDIKLLDGSTTQINIETLDGTTVNEQIAIKLTATSTGALKIDNSNILDENASLAAIDSIDKALKTLNDSRADLGATLNRLDHNATNLNNQAINMAASASQIEDADMAKEMSEMTKFKILNEAGVSMLSQANQTPQMVSKLLQ